MLESRCRKWKSQVWFMTLSFLPDMSAGAFIVDRLDR
jgi:hypothetical protein